MYIFIHIMYVLMRDCVLYLSCQVCVYLDTHVHTNNIIYNIYIYIYTYIDDSLSITAITITNFYVCKFLQIIIYLCNHHFFSFRLIIFN